MAHILELFRRELSIIPSDIIEPSKATGSAAPSLLYPIKPFAFASSGLCVHNHKLRQEKSSSPLNQLSPARFTGLVIRARGFQCFWQGEVYQRQNCEHQGCHGKIWQQERIPATGMKKPRLEQANMVWLGRKALRFGGELDGLKRDTPLESRFMACLLSWSRTFQKGPLTKNGKENAPLAR